MKLCLKIFVVAIVAALTYSLIGCAAPNGFSYSNVSITLNQFCTYTCSSVSYDPNTIPPLSTSNTYYAWEIASGTDYFFTANVVNAPANFTWALYPTENLVEPTDPVGNGTGEASAGATDGSFYVGPNNSGPTVIYLPPSPPIFSGAALQQAETFNYTTSYTEESVSVNGVPSLKTITAPQTGIPMGYVLLAVSVPSNPQDPTQNYTHYQLMEITGGLNTFLIPSTPTNPSGLTTPAVTVPRGTSFQFYGGAIGNGPCGTVASCSTQAAGLQTLGSIDDTVVWTVGSSPSTNCISGVVGCTSIYGTVSSSGLYTAPTVSPTGVFPFTAVVIMEANTLKTTTKTAYITVN
jgi:hypothetical protein